MRAKAVLAASGSGVVEVCTGSKAFTSIEFLLLSLHYASSAWAAADQAGIREGGGAGEGYTIVHWMAVWEGVGGEATIKGVEP